MLYDLSQAPPEPESLLESVFLVLTKRRQEQEYLRTRVLVEAVLAPHMEGDSKISETFADYTSAMFPYLGKHKAAGRDVALKEALHAWTSKKAFRVRPLWLMKDKPSRFRSSLTRGRKAVEEREKLRKAGVTKRI